MTEAQLQQIHRAVNHILRTEHGLGRLNPGRYDVLVQQVRQQLAANDLDELELCCAVLLCALGPARPVPAIDICMDFVDIAQTLALDMYRLPEIAIAYGCGKWRDVTKQGSPWQQHWPGAIQQLILALESTVRDSNLWLAQHLVDYPEKSTWRGEAGAELVARDAAYLAIQLTCTSRALHSDYGQELNIESTEDETALHATEMFSENLPAGSRLVFETTRDVQLEIKKSDNSTTKFEIPQGQVFAVRAVDNGTRLFLPKPLPQVVLQMGESARLAPLHGLQQWLCGCGNRNCRERHRLSAWDPHKVSLWSFIVSAVKGPSVELKLGTFITGMYLPILSREGTAEGGRVRQAEVEFKVCQSEKCNSTDPQYKFEGEGCPSCHTPFSTATTPRDKFERLIVVGNPAPSYERQSRYYCRAQTHGRLDNFNLHEDDQCPLCHSPRAARATHVWVRTFAVNLLIDQDQVLRDSLAAQSNDDDDDEMDFNQVDTQH